MGGSFDMDPSHFPPNFADLDPFLLGRALVYLFPICFILYLISVKYYYRNFFFALMHIVIALMIMVAIIIRFPE